MFKQFTLVAVTNGAPKTREPKDIIFTSKEPSKRCSVPASSGQRSLFASYALKLLLMLVFCFIWNILSLVSGRSRIGSPLNGTLREWQGIHQPFLESKPMGGCASHLNQWAPPFGGAGWCRFSSVLPCLPSVESLQSPPFVIQLAIEHLKSDWICHIRNLPHKVLIPTTYQDVRVADFGSLENGTNCPRCPFTTYCSLTHKFLRVTKKIKKV